ncbi:hypothetical protein [Plantactinospora sp. CA-290183]|uniref:hypothetical protein n=1 Tax=Plantactinospora sp. CA-290183 TaxID=3240006 RepID=UPI003D8EB045
MARLLSWVAGNLDAFFGLLVALVVSILGLNDDVSRRMPRPVPRSWPCSPRRCCGSGGGGTRPRRRPGGCWPSTTRLDALLPHLAAITADDGVLARARTAINSVSMVRVLNGQEVGQAHAEARRQTDRWRFKGGTGTFTRAVTLPECIEHARRRNGTLDFGIEIIDPTDEQVCERYAQFRRSLAPRTDGTGELWTVDRTRKESFATVLAACWHHQRSGLLNIDVRLSSQMSTFRFDLSSSCVIITQENPQTPALRIDRREIYYHRYSIELQYSREQSRRVPIEQARQVLLDDEPSVEQARKLFTALGLPLPRSFGDREVSDIIVKAIQARNPYE